MAAIKRNRSLERGLKILEVLQSSPGSTLQDLWRSTKIPKSTLRRLLITLEDSGFARRGIADGLYRANLNLQRIPAHLHQFDYLLEAASPVMRKLSEREMWPSDLFVRTGDCMQVVETTRTCCAFSARSYAIGDSVYMPISAVGRAYLAFCPDEEREAILASLRNSIRIGSGSSFWQHLRDALGETRTQGYGVRAPGYYGETINNPAVIDGMASIAVPIMHGNSIHGCINQVWPRSTMSVHEFARRQLGKLNAAANEIASRVAASAATASGASRKTA